MLAGRQLCLFHTMPTVSHYAFLLLLFFLQLPSGSIEEGAALQQNNFNTPLSCFHCCITCAYLSRCTWTQMHTILRCTRCQMLGNKCNVIQKGARASAEFPVSFCDISIRRYYPFCLTATACVCNLYIPAFAGQGKQTSECTELIKTCTILSVNKEKGFSPSWLCSSRLPPPTEHSVRICLWRFMKCGPCVHDELGVLYYRGRSCSIHTASLTMWS